jgi:hypothetical protein
MSNNIYIFFILCFGDGSVKAINGMKPWPFNRGSNIPINFAGEGI